MVTDRDVVRLKENKLSKEVQEPSLVLLNKCMELVNAGGFKHQGVPELTFFVMARTDSTLYYIDISRSVSGRNVWLDTANIVEKEGEERSLSIFHPRYADGFVAPALIQGINFFGNQTLDQLTDEQMEDFNETFLKAEVDEEATAKLFEEFSKSDAFSNLRWCAEVDKDVGAGGWKSFADSI